MNKELENNKSLEVRRDWKNIFYSYLRFLQYCGRKGWQFFKGYIFYFGMETFFLVGLYMAHVNINQMQTEFEKVVTVTSAPANRFESTIKPE